MLLLLLLTGCRAPEAFVVWQGFNYRWSELSHRVSLVRAWLEPDGGLSMGLVGGSWSTGAEFTDDAAFRMRWAALSSDQLYAVHGETELLVGPEGFAEQEVTLDAEGLLSWPDHVVLLRGFWLDTDVAQSADYPGDYDPALGYTSRGFGVALGTPRVEGDTLRFTASARADWGPSGEGDPADRSDMNGAAPYATTGMTIAWTALGFKGPSTRSLLGADSPLEHDPPYSDQGPVSAEITPSSDYNLNGIAGFDLRIEPQDGGGEGEYLRSFGAELVQDDRGGGEVLAEVTTSSIIELVPMQAAAEVLLVRARLRGAEPQLRSEEGTHPVGLHEF